ncbi:hypothetical protein HDU87_004063 [Geranomyces variabilis]|uniref:Ribosomal protein L17 n=1 Tax=Geranomyces variabilis TaxID=109894 RepID=A0AAD5TR37_9FUNG|nr:hypothetical protein HDU87_004063 [Geranomyces variabilis]
MKHGLRFWRKKLGRTPSHRASLLRNLLTQLVYHERIETTLAKAKFMQRQADKLIEWTKRGTPLDLRKAKDMLFVDHITFNKLRGPLMARYATRKGGYTRLHLNGHRGLASDRAPLAIIELVDNPNDIIHGLAKLHLPKLQTQLAQVESQLYTRSVIPIQDPVTGESAHVVRLEDRHDVSGRVKEKLTGKEKALLKMIGKMRKALESYPQARAAEQAHAERVRVERAGPHKRIVELVQEKLNAAVDKAAGEPGFEMLGGAFAAALADARLEIVPGTVTITKPLEDSAAENGPIVDVLTQDRQMEFVERVRQHLDAEVAAAAPRFPTPAAAASSNTSPRSKPTANAVSSTSNSSSSASPSSSPARSPTPTPSADTAFGPEFEARFSIDAAGNLELIPSAAERAYEGVAVPRINPVHLADGAEGVDGIPFEREVPDDIVLEEEVPMKEDDKPAVASTVGRLWGKITGARK